MWHGFVNIFGANLLEWNTNPWLDSDWTGVESEGWDRGHGEHGRSCPCGLYNGDSLGVSDREELHSSWWDERVLDAKMLGHEDSVKSHKLIFCERNGDGDSLNISDGRTRYLAVLQAAASCGFLWCWGLAKAPDLFQRMRSVFYPKHMILTWVKIAFILAQFY